MRLQQTLQKLRNQFRAKRRHQGIKKSPLRLQLEQLEARVVPTGTWQGLTNLSPDSFGTGTMLLLSDGSVMVQGGYDTLNNQHIASSAWYELTPDTSGDYVDGTWKTLKSSNVGRYDYGSAVLPDGRVFVLGGEFTGSSATATEANSGEIYDPVANSWTNIANFQESQFGDGVVEVLPNGEVLAGGKSGTPYIYNPANNSWTAAANTLNGDNFSEEGWVKLAESGINGVGIGNLLDYQVQSTPVQTAVRYDPASNTWNPAGSVPVNLTTTGGGSIVPELGPGLLLPDGQVFWIGATNHTALYTPSTNSWAAGPDTPNDANGNVVGAFDAPAAVEPNGKVLYAASPPTVASDGTFGKPTTIYEYDPSSNTTTAVPDTNGPDLSAQGFVNRMVVLPDGEVLFSNDGRKLFLYRPDSGPNPSWAPTVSDISSFAGTGTLSGTQLNGLSEGASYGDDATMASNYPIIRLFGSDSVTRFARTSNWSSTGVATGNALESVNFTMPGGAPNANIMTVIANGIPSANVLYVTGTGGNDTITLDTFTFFGVNFIQVTVDGVTSNWLAGALSSVFVDTRGGSVTVNVNHTWSGIPTVINGGGFFVNDTIDIGAGGSVQGIGGNVTIENTPAFNNINIDDSADTTGRTTTLQTVTIANDRDGDSDKFGQVAGLAPGVISYEYNDTKSINIKTGTGGSTVNVLATGTTTNLIGSFGTTVNVGNAGSVQGILDTLNIENPPSVTRINVDDSADSTARTVTLSTIGANSADSEGNTDPWGRINGLAPANINYEYFDTSSVTINTGNVAGNVVDVLATGAITNVIGINLTTISVGNAGSVQGIQRSLNIDNPLSFNSITVDDSADGTARTTFLGTFTPSGDTNWGFISGLAPANIDYEYADTTSITIKTGKASSSSNVVNVLATGVTTNLVGQGLTTVNIGSNAPSLGGTLANIAGPVNLSSSSLTTLVVDDSGDTTARTATITSNSISGTWSQGAIHYVGNQVSSLTLHGGNAANTFNVLSTSTTTTIDGGTGNDAFDVGSNGTSAGIVKNINSNLTLNGGGGSNRLTLDDSGNTTTTDTVNLTPTSTGGSSFFGAGGSLAYSAINSVTLQSSNASFTDSHGAVHGDTITVTPQRGILFTINGNNPTVAPGDSLTVSLVNGNVTIHPQFPGTGFFTFTGSLLQVVRYTGIETLSPAGWLVAGADAGGEPEVKVFDAQSGQLRFDFLAFAPSFHGGVRVAVGDVNGDGIPDIITAEGPGGEPLVHVYDGITAKLLAGPLGSFDAFDPAFHGGIWVASADVNGDGYADIIVGEDAGGEPRVRVFSGKTGQLLDDFQAFDHSFHGGVRVAAADLNHDGQADVIVGLGSGGPPLVRVFEGADLTKGLVKPVLSFDAFDPAFTGGVYVAAGDVHGDGTPKIIVGEGAGGHSLVSVFDGNTGDQLQSFRAFQPGFRGGVRVAAADVNGDGRSDIVTAAGPGGPPRVRGWDGLSLEQIDEFFAFDPNFRDGVFVAGGGRWR